MLGGFFLFVFWWSFRSVEQKHNRLQEEADDFSLSILNWETEETLTFRQCADYAVEHMLWSSEHTFILCVWYTLDTQTELWVVCFICNVMIRLASVFYSICQFHLQLCVIPKFTLLN